VEGIKQAINYAADNKGGVMILRRVGDTYWKDANGVNSWDKNKIVPIRVPKVFSSGHEEFLYGYDEEPNTGRIRIYWLNHWSKDWADKGRAWEYLDEWLPYINEIRVVVAALPPAPSDFTYYFTKTIKEGDKGADVLALQHALDLEGCYDYNPTDGSPKYTGNFVKGGYTFKAVVKFQEKYASEILAPIVLTKGTGVVASMTLKKLNALYHK
jgi:hypothetical protein